MKTFKWTIPEPQHADHTAMTRPELETWERVRERGVEWFVVTKGVGFLLAYPLLAHLALGQPFTAQLLCEGWFVGLVSGFGVWLWRERRYERSVERDAAPPS